MKLPENIRILGVDHEVVQVNSRGMSGGNFGEFDATKCTLHVDTIARPEVQAGTLLHEVIEALNYRLELKLPHHVIQSLDAGLLQVARDNPEFWRNVAK